MTSNDSLLIRMIDNDMKLKGVDCFYMVDVIEYSPTTIKVGANEAVYIHYFNAQPEGGFGPPADFYVHLQSGTSLVQYYNAITTGGQSNIISKHFENIFITGIPLPNEYYIHYVRVKF